MSNLKAKFIEVLEGYLPDWDVEQRFATQCDKLATMLVESVAEQSPKRAIPDEAICFYKDGDAWCCVNGDFVDLQESPSGFGSDFSQALDNLQAARKSQV